MAFPCFHHGKLERCSSESPKIQTDDFNHTDSIIFLLIMTHSS